MAFFVSQMAGSSVAHACTTLSVGFTGTLARLRTCGGARDYGGIDITGGLFRNTAGVAEEFLGSRSAEEVERTIDSLRGFLGDGPFQWLCACAIYPELQWDLTISIGALACMPANLVSEENIVRLASLEWFRSGAIPDEARRELLARIDPAVESAVREAIIGILERSPAPQGTFAASAHQFQIAYQRHRAKPGDHEAERAFTAAMKTMSPDEIQQDYAYLDADAALPNSPINFILPRRLRKLLYPASGPWFGMRRVVRLGVAMLAVGACLSTLKLLDRRLEVERREYQSQLALGLGLSVSEARSDGTNPQQGNFVKASWLTNKPAVVDAQSGLLTITDGSYSLKVPLNRDQILQGAAEYAPSTREIKIELAMVDEAQNTTVQQTRLISAKNAPNVPSLRTLASQIQAPPRGTVHLGSKVFQPPPVSASNTAESPTLDMSNLLPPSTQPSQGGLSGALSVLGVVPSLISPSTRVGTPKKGRTFGLFVGISRYKYDPPVTSLNFADADALLMSQFFLSPRGGMKSEDAQVLTNEKATRLWDRRQPVRNLSRAAAAPEEHSDYLRCRARSIPQRPRKIPTTHKTIRTRSQTF